MTLNLTWSLVALGAVVLLAVLAQGWWTARRAGPRRAAGHADVRVEPSMAGVSGDGSAAGSAAGSTDLQAVPEGLPEFRLAPLKRVARIDALIDAIVPMTLEAPVSGELLIAQQPPSRRAGTKPFYVEGLDAETGEWDAPTPGRRYSELQAGVQLASRSGPLNEIEYSEFLQKIGTFADAVGAAADVPDMLEVVARARELDGQAGPLDAQLTVKLRSNSVAWSVAYVQQVAARAGLVPGAVPGRMVLPSADEGAPPLLVLSVDSQAALAEMPQDSVVRECLLSFDVPQSPESAEPFPAWHRLATTLADDMDATAVDDQDRPVMLQAYAAIGRDLEDLYRRLEALDLAAGSPAARRLFS